MSEEHIIHATMTLCELSLAESIILHGKYSEWKKGLTRDPIDSENVMKAAKQIGYLFMVFVWMAQKINSFGDISRKVVTIYLPIIAFIIAFIPLLDAGYSWHLNEKCMFWTSMTSFIITTLITINLHSVAVASRENKVNENIPIVDSLPK